MLSSLGDIFRALGLALNIEQKALTPSSSLNLSSVIAGTRLYAIVIGIWFAKVFQVPMQRTNLAIKREMLKYFRNKKIPCSNYYGLTIENCPCDILDGYVYAYMMSGNGQRFTYQVEYFNPRQWYFKFKRIKALTAGVDNVSPIKNSAYGQTKKSNRANG